MKKLFLALVACGALVAGTMDARRCGTCPKRSCRKSCGKVTESCDPKPKCCVTVCHEEQREPNVHIHKTYSCPTGCEQREGDEE